LVLDFLHIRCCSLGRRKVLLRDLFSYIVDA
jgi:hypothetical protein